jgi:hypothetical protein
MENVRVVINGTIKAAKEKFATARPGGEVGLAAAGRLRHTFTTRGAR